MTHLKRPWCWEGLRAGGEGDNRGWDGWVASPTQWTWVWVHSESWWWTGRPGMLWFMGSQRVGHDWETELNWTKYHKLGDILDIYFSQFWRLENQKIKALADSIWQGPSSWYINGIFLRCPHIAEEVRDLFEVSKDTNPIHEGSILMS